MDPDTYPATLRIDYPDRPLDRVSSFFRIFAAIPIVIVLGAVTGSSTATTAGGGVLFAPVLLMLVFRGKYPRWWFDWNLELTRFGQRVCAYLALMDDRYPSTDEEQSVHVELTYPDAATELGRGMPLVKWLLALPHYLVLCVLGIGAVCAVLGAWVAILFTGRYPRGLFGYVEGVMRWGLRVNAYAFLLVTDRYPPFRLGA